MDRTKLQQIIAPMIKLTLIQMMQMFVQKEKVFLPKYDQHNYKAIF